MSSFSDNEVPKSRRTSRSTQRWISQDTLYPGGTYTDSRTIKRISRLDMNDPRFEPAATALRVACARKDKIAAAEAVRCLSELLLPPFRDFTPTHEFRVARNSQEKALRERRWADAEPPHPWSMRDYGEDYD